MTQKEYNETLVKGAQIGHRRGFACGVCLATAIFILSEIVIKLTSLKWQ